MYGRVGGSSRSARRARDALGSSFDFQHGLCVQSEPRSSAWSCLPWGPNRPSFHPTYIIMDMLIFVMQLVTITTSNMNTTTASLDLGAESLTIHQPSTFFDQQPQELRDCIYELVFASPTLPTCRIAEPLLTCRQSYLKTRSIVLASIDWHIDIGRVCKAHFDNKFLEAGQPVSLTIESRTGVPDSSCNAQASRLGSLYFTVRELAIRAGLSTEHCHSLRHLTILNGWCELYSTDDRDRPHNTATWYVLHGLDAILAREN
jgi:hypothetical protein